MPKIDVESFLGGPGRGPVCVAHGGVGAEWEKNSLSGLLAAYEAGVRFFEIDLRTTSDGRIVVWHGAGVDRIWRLTPITAKSFGAEEPVLFETVLATLPQDAKFFLDVKDVPTTYSLPHMLQRVGNFERLCIGSFSALRTRRTARSIQALSDYMLPKAMASRDVAELLWQARRPSSGWCPNADTAQLPAWAISERTLEVARAAGMPVIVWTVNDEAAMHRLLEAGVDGLITDAPSTLLRILGR